MNWLNVYVATVDTLILLCVAGEYLESRGLNKLLQKKRVAKAKEPVNDVANLVGQ